MHIELVIDCDDADAMTTFWTEALGYVAHGRFEQYRSIVDPSGEGPTVILQQVADRTAGKNAVHLDMHVPDVAATVERLRTLGALEVHTVEIDGALWVTMRDIEGNHFCVCRQHG